VVVVYRETLMCRLWLVRVSLADCRMVGVALAERLLVWWVMLHRSRMSLFAKSGGGDAVEIV
jgi:hypothetical protein